MDELLTLAEAADKLGIAPVTLRAGIARGTLRARKFGTTWVTTEEEVDRYGRDSLGKVGRPAYEKPVIITGERGAGEFKPAGTVRPLSDEEYLELNGIPRRRIRRPSARSPKTA